MDKLLDQEIFYPQKYRDKFNQEKKLAVFSSGGILFFDMIGFMSMMQVMKMTPRYEVIIGTSSGALMGLIITSQIWIRDLMLEIMKKLNNRYFAQLDFYSVYNLLAKSYLQKQGNLRVELIELILKFCFGTSEITFRDHFRRTGRKLILVCTNLTDNRVFYMSVDTLPGTKLFDALLAATSAPYFWSPHEIQIQGQNKLFYDGSITQPFPLDCFLNQCSRYPYEKETGVEIQQATENNLFGLRLIPPSAGYNPVFSRNVVTPAAQSDLNLFTVVSNLTNGSLYYSQSNITGKWLKQVAEINTLFNYSITEQITMKIMVDGFNNGVRECVKMLKAYESSDGRGFN